MVAAVLSGNRNFEGRIHPLVRRPTTWRARPWWWPTRWRAPWTSTSPRSPWARPNGRPVYLRGHLAPDAEVRERWTGRAPGAVPPRLRGVFRATSTGTHRCPWRASCTTWDPASTYIQEPPFFQDLHPGAAPASRPSAGPGAGVLGDSVTTDHISPGRAHPAGQPRRAATSSSGGCRPRTSTRYGARRGNHEVMVRGTFGNIRMRNRCWPPERGRR
ncbi:MAG: hypothetical protein KatS3mg131_3001 [Candidatus Tectimicrobiota bacterium]|nr:MAG: hypothetical protein KatS3mg131_3001 [Candidatus Tectomicrobia bacterium]